jgi:hypothetical protein
MVKQTLGHLEISLMVTLVTVTVEPGVQRDGMLTGRKMLIGSWSNAGDSTFNWLRLGHLQFHCKHGVFS